MDKKEIEKKFLAIIGSSNLPPEELFAKAGVLEREARDVLASLIDSGRVVVGKGWRLRLSEQRVGAVADAHG